MSNNGELKILCGTSNEPLAKEISEYLGHSLIKRKINRFKDGEIGVQIEENVRGADLYLIQSLSPPVNDFVMEMLILIDALKRANVKRVVCVVPYYGYARQDRKNKPRVPISAAMLAKLIETAGADKVIAMDLHAGQIQGFFRIPTDNLAGQFTLVDVFTRKVKDLKNVCVVSPDAGGVERAYSFRKALKDVETDLEVSMAMMNKHREEANVVATMELVGKVKDMDCVIVDDMVDTAGTLCKAAEVLKENGAKRVFACISHGLLNEPATERIDSSPIESILITNSINLPKEKLTKKIVVCSVAKLLGEAIRRVHNDESISSLFKN
eukprot:gene5071-8671_t